MGLIKMILEWLLSKLFKQEDIIDYDYYISVKETMENTELPRPKHKSKFIVNYGEILPIILVECEV